MSEVIGSVQVVVRPDTTGFAERARKGIERQFKRKNALELDFEVDPDKVRQDVEDAREVAQGWLDLKKNALQIHARLAWRKTDLLRQLRDFKSDVEALEVLQRPTVYANVEVDRKGLDKLRESVKLNVAIDDKALQRALKNATKDVTVFGNQKAVKKEAEGVAKLTSKIFQDTFEKRKLKLAIKGDTEKIEEMRDQLVLAYRDFDQLKGRAFDLSDALSNINKQVDRQKSIVTSLGIEWEEMKENGAQNGRHMAAVANELSDAEESLRKMVAQQEKLNRKHNLFAGNIFKPSQDGLDKLQRDYDDLRAKLRDHEVEFKAVADRTSFAAVSAELAVMARDRVVVFWAATQKASMKRLTNQWQTISRATESLAVNAAKWIGQLSGVRVLWRTFMDMVEWLPRLDMMVPQLAQTLALVTSAAASAVGAVGVLFTLLSDIGEVGKLLVGMPAIIAGIAGSALILGRALYDFKEVFPEIISYYEKLGNVVSDNVWKKAAGPIRELHKATSKLLSEHVPDWASAWGDSLGSLAKGVGSSQGLAHLEMFLKNSILGTKNAEAGWESLGSAIMRMVGAGSNVFPDLGTWFSDTMGKFDDWAKSNQANIEIWLREGGKALRELGSIGVSTVKIIGGIGAAFSAAGWPGLTELESAMRSIAESAKGLKDSDGFMQTLGQVRGFFTELKTLGPQASLAIRNAWAMIGDSVEVLTGPITGAIGGILDGFNSSKFQNGFGKFVTGMGSFIKDITPGLEATVAEIGSLLEVVGTAGKSWGPAFNDMLLLFSSAGDKLHPGITEFVENLGPRLQELVTNITPHVEDFAEAISDLFGNENFQDLVGDIINDLGKFGGIILDLGAWIAETAGKFSDWYGGLSEGNQALARIVGWMTAAFGGVAVVLGGAAIKILGFINSISGLGAVIEWVKNLKVTQAFGGLVGRIIDPIKKIPGLLVRAIGAIGRGIGTAFASLGRMIGSAVGKIKLPNLGKLASSLGRVLTPIWNWVKGIPGQLLKFLPKGGLMKLLGKALTRFVPVVGWALLISDILNLIKPVKVLDWVDGILDKLGLGDGWLSKVVDVIRNSIESAFGADVGLGDLFLPVVNMITKAWDGMVAGWDEGGLWGAVKGFFSGLGEGFLDHFQLGWEVIKGLVESFAPQGVIDFFQDPWGKIKGWLGLDKWGGGIPSVPELLNWGVNLWNNKIGPWLKNSWAALVGWARQWSPVNAVIEFFQDPWGKIKGWLGLDSWGNGIPNIPELLNWGTGLWNEKIKPWLQESWDKLVGFIKEWNPVSVAFRMATWIADKIKEWLGIGDGGLDLSSFSIDFDFSSLWEQKIKPALKTGMLALAGLITAPGLLLIAPLAMPALIIGWLLGRDGEGNWSFDELKSKVTGAWDKIKSKLTEGVENLKNKVNELRMKAIDLGKKVVHWLIGKAGEAKENFDEFRTRIEGGWEDIKSAIGTAIGTIGGLIGGLVFTPIAIGEKIVDWVLGSDWVSKAANGLTNAIEGAKETLSNSVNTAVDKVKTGIKASVPAAQGGIVASTLGVDDESKGKIVANFDTVRGVISRWGIDTRGEYSSTQKSAGGSVGKLWNESRKKFDDMRTNAKSNTSGMKNDTTGNFSAMSRSAAAKAGQMQAQVIQKIGAMQSMAAVKAVALQRSVVQAMTRANTLSVAQSRMMSTAYVAQIRQMAAGAVRVAGTLRSTLPRALTINASGPGRSTGSTFVSGLASGLSRAVSVARSMANGIRRALSFNVRSSGASVGGSFASGLRSKISAVSSAARQLASAARTKLPNSPAKEGPFAGKGWGGWGESIADELARGMRMGAPAVALEASRMMSDAAAELSNTPQIEFMPDVRSVRNALSAEQGATPGPVGGTTVNVEVVSRSEEPLQDGNRFGGDIAFALRGAGLA